MFSEQEVNKKLMLERFQELLLVPFGSGLLRSWWTRVIKTGRGNAPFEVDILELLEPSETTIET